MKPAFYWLFLFVISIPVQGGPAPNDTQLLQDLERSCKSHPKDWRRYYNLSRLYDQQGQYEQAIQASSQALELCRQKDKQEQIFYNLGNMYFDQAKSLEGQLDAKINLLEKSIQAYDAALAFDPTASDTRKNRADVQKALEELKRKKQEQEPKSEHNKQPPSENQPPKDPPSSDQPSQNKPNDPKEGNTQSRSESSDASQSENPSKLNEDRQTSELLLEQEQQNEKLFPVQFSAPQNTPPVLKDW